ncbi:MULTISPECIES: protealysin inhibitor emfourin [unclassified Rhodococcus (in: high G+C Gram-positive bacteria)]|jgi:hypothetical protein|uniref:protealysin inhibitor emfourin n=1 Tax=unclassified Rhodococcus (in: high G+C Gram-positive bacteria) TaxID=192944 RepID=UPI0004829079|nr:MULTISPECIES: protealysin inhibitor emfourin [unclassified Rhodococcus (in: high G+C Gram-positive bacteria)]KQU39250.1 hypothetical protein ASG69_12350 [Rhodococcus sp. Leaf225]KQU43686.1 hypothetical protein ASH03_14025 [Rhodococcus sp. Leaf258]MBY6679128.1 hypothetical protein [Rhodococcus sp. BP-332]MBY6683330.1 hypothetical protein [Rhodococcus sp. BP-316]MBY6685339.1 hypothetical protein [Rhodococcus sp. BP-288]
MVIVVVRSGGVAGMTRRGSVDTTALGDTAPEWEQLVTRALPLLNGLPESSSLARDTFRWRLEIGEHSCETGDSALTGPLRELAERTLREGRSPR